MNNQKKRVMLVDVSDKYLLGIVVTLFLDYRVTARALAVTSSSETATQLSATDKLLS